MKFEDVFGGVMPSSAGVNASLSKDLDHVGEAEICCIRRGRSQCRRGMYVGEDCGGAAPIQLRGIGGVRRMTSSLRPLTE